MSTRQERIRRRRRKKMIQRMKIAGILAVFLLIILAVIFGVRACVLNSGSTSSTVNTKETFLAGTTVNGIDISEMTAGQASSAIEKYAESYQVTVDFGNVVNSPVILSASELGLEVNPDFDISKLLQEQKESKNQTLQADNIFEVNQVVLNTSLQEKAGIALTDDTAGTAENGSGAGERISEAGEEQTVETHTHDPANATIVYSVSLGTYEIQEGTAKYQISETQALALLNEAVNDGATEVSMQSLLSAPEGAIMPDDAALQEALEQMNARLGVTLTYVMNDGQKETIEKKTLINWMYFDENEKKMSYDSEQILNDLSDIETAHENVSSSQEFKTSTGGVMTINVPAEAYVLDLEGMLADITAALDQMVSGERAAVYKANTSATINGGTYVEVDVTNQTIYLYKDGTLVLSSPCVTGNVSLDYTTPEGVFKLTNKMKDATLVGENYATPVSYWMPFNGGIGLHDAWWRQVFGGDEYLYNGSHGCVNLPLDVAEIVYDTLSIGDYVIVYGGITYVEPKETETTEESTEETETETETVFQTETAAVETTPATSAETVPAPTETTSEPAAVPTETTLDVTEAPAEPAAVPAEPTTEPTAAPAEPTAVAAETTSDVTAAPAEPTTEPTAVPVETTSEPTAAPT